MLQDLWGQSSEFLSQNVWVSNICKDRIKLFVLFVDARKDRKELFAFKTYSLYGWIWMMENSQASLLLGESARIFMEQIDRLAGWVVMGSHLMPPEV